MKDKYEKIQSCLFELIPEKWDEIYLFASVIDRAGDVQTGEMFFYYIPKIKILKKKPVNVYEVPKKFNINEDEYKTLLIQNKIYGHILQFLLLIIGLKLSIFMIVFLKNNMLAMLDM